MVTDARGHEVPSSNEAYAAIAAFKALSDSINDVITTTDLVVAETRRQEMEAAGLPTTGSVWAVTNEGHLYIYTGSEFVRMVDTRDVVNTGWMDLSSSLNDPPTAAGSVLKIRASYSTVQITGELLGEFPDTVAAIDVLSPGAIPEELRPADAQGDTRTIYTGSTYLQSAWPGNILARPDGSLAYWHRTGVAARNSLRFSLSYAI